ncbi:hypothetical protein C5167_023874 [Papaver somniferum]|uniref:Uncharacterized protein n=1 Tax=Papaver somniferum TaxID=3469 RepID=A0A4Y7JLY4_PAPSO|nr:hypothetical protein C5167_023874 [Papaver somniferum]
MKTLTVVGFFRGMGNSQYYIYKLLIAGSLVTGLYIDFVNFAAEAHRYGHVGYGSGEKGQKVAREIGFRTGCWLLHWIFKQVLFVAFCGDVVVVLDMVVAEYLSSLKAPRMEVTPKMLEFMRNLRKVSRGNALVYVTEISSGVLLCPNIATRGLTLLVWIWTCRLQEKPVQLKKDNVEKQVEALTWHLQLIALGMFKVLRVKCYY